MLTFGIDWDDVISPLNDCAIELANEEYHFEPPLTLEDIDSWENTGRASVIKKYYSDPRLYEMQQVSDQAKAFIRTLQTKGIVYIVTAVQPQFMSKRESRSRRHFRISRMKISLWDFRNPWFRWTLRWMTDRIIY